MRLTFLSIITILVCAFPSARAEIGGDGGDYFVSAYAKVQQAEKAEAGGNLKLALTDYREAARLLNLVTSKFPTWSPEIVDYRKKLTGEAIVRLQQKTAHGGQAVEPDLPGDGPIKFAPPDEVRTPETPPTIIANEPPPASRKGSRKSEPSDVTSDISQITERVKQLQMDLQNAHDEVTKLHKDNAATVARLDEALKAKAISDKQQEVLQKRAAMSEEALQKEINSGRASNEKIALMTRDVAEAKKALNKSKMEAEAEQEYTGELNQRYKAQIARINTLTAQRDDAKKTSNEAPGKIEAIQKQLDATKKEKDQLALKLQTTETQLHAVTTQRDDALAQVAKLKDAQKQVDKLVSDNATLMAKLTDAQKSVAQFKLEGIEKDKAIVELKKEVGSVREQLDAAKKESAEYQKKMGDLQEKLEDSAKQLAAAKTEGTESAAEKKKMQEENQILRGIVLRQQKKEAERTAMKKVVLGELNKLEINSKTLLKQIEFLSEPVVKLSPKERALFKKPELQVTDTEISILIPNPNEPPAPVAAAPTTPEVPLPEPQPAVAPAPTAPAAPPATPAPTASSKKRDKANSKSAAAARMPDAPPAPKPEDSVKPELSLTPSPAAPLFDIAKNVPPTSPLIETPPRDQTGKSAPPPNEPTPNKPVEDSMTPPPPITSDSSRVGGSLDLPSELIPLAKEGKEQFDRGNYLEAEKTYRRILTKAPRNLHTLSNLGVVLFRSGKLKLSEETFNKAIAVAPEDGFSHCTLGIVYYSETKLEEAVNELTKALAINPKNATAHNYLGITASQKGWGEAAQKELETAISLDPSYADAYFNLAVVYATQTPPNKELARKNYKRAIELGAEADAALEQLIK